MAPPARPSRLGTFLRLLAAGSLVMLWGCGSGSAARICSDPASAGCTRILFLGNSYTYVNDLPGTFSQLAWSAGRQVETSSVANGGETLQDHAGSSDSQAAINSGGWRFVVLQEQSEMPAVDGSRTYFMYPAARTLAGRVRAVGARTMFFMTWAHQDGLASSGLPGYESMQLAVDDGYEGIAGELGAPVAPVGYTWFVVRRDHPEIDLWQADGSHPTTAGTYLAACVFYAAIFGQSPEGLAFEDGLPDASARILQTEASRNVLGLKVQWGLP